MSRVAKEVGRAFKKVTREFRNLMNQPVVRAVITAVIAYYSFGAAMGAMQPAAGAASGAVSGAGSGAMSTAVVSGAQSSPMWIGGAAGGSALGGASGTLAGIEGLVAAGNASIATAGATVGGAGAAALGAGGATAAGGIMSEAVGEPSVWNKIANYGKELPGKAVEGWKGMSVTDKLSMTKMGVDVVGSLFGPTPEDVYNAKYEAENKWYGAGLSDLPGGSTMTTDEMNAARGKIGSPASSPEMATTAPEQMGAAVPPQQTQNVAPGPQKAGPRVASAELFANPAGVPEEETQNPMLFGEGQMQQMINVPGSIYAPTPGVRYI